MTPKPTPTLRISRQAGLGSSHHLTSRFLFHTLRSDPHSSFRSTLFIPVHTPHSGSHSSFRSTLPIPVHTLHSGPHSSFRFTLLIPVHTPHSGPHSSFRFTLLIPIHTLHFNYPHSSFQVATEFTATSLIHRPKASEQFGQAQNFSAAVVKPPK